MTDPTTKVPVHVLFLGAGASKAAGFPSAAELLAALRDPAAFGVEPARSQYQMLPQLFERNRRECLEFIDTLHCQTGLKDLALLSKAFEALQLLTVGGSTVFEMSPEQACDTQTKLVDCFDIILHPTYNARCTLAPYQRLARLVRQWNGWTVVISTNWDYVADVCFSDAFEDLEGGIDWGVGDANHSVWMGAIPQMAAYAHANGRPFVSFYKPNGSTGWLVCRYDSLIFARHFHRPHNLDDLLLLNRARGMPPGSCSACGRALVHTLHTPGISRQAHPLKDIMYFNIGQAVLHCEAMTFVGFSCPPEDADLMQVLAENLAATDDHRAIPIVPCVVDLPGPHLHAVRTRYEQALGREISVLGSGFDAWTVAEEAKK